jgi:anaerobic selenocysteine-containing dehydrogenase
MTILDLAGTQTRTVRTFCSLCKVICPAVVTVEGSRPISLEPDRAHPRGGAVCAKGRAAPEMHDHPHRVNYPLRRTRPKTSPDPGWERCSWDEALDLIAAKLREIRDTSGAHAVAFSRGTGSATGVRDTDPWFTRLANHFGTPNMMSTTHVCNWSRDGAAYYTYGLGTLPLPETENSGCIVLWGTNPSATQLGLARDVIAARARGARLVVIDPRRVGVANKADMVLQVRPGTDGALALAFVDVLLQEHLYDARFTRAWTNAPLLVRTGTDRLLAAADVARERLAQDGLAGATTPYLALDQETGRLVAYDAATRQYSRSADALALHGSTEVRLADGSLVACRTVFDLLAEAARRSNPAVAAEITGVPASQIVEAVRLIAASRPVSHYLYNGLVQHTNGVQACRAIEIFYALLGDFDRAGGNVIPPSPKVADIAARGALPAEAAKLRLGAAERPLGPASVPPGNIAAFDLYRSVLDGEPYRVRALVALGNNVLLANADSAQGREALQQLEFFAQAELFHTPTSQFADVLLPAADFLESESLSLSLGVRAQRRPLVVEPLYERRSDVEVVFGLATRLGLGDRFGDGDPVRAYDEILAPAGLSWAALQDEPNGVRIAPPTRYEKHADERPNGSVVGFGTPSGKLELFSDTFAAHGHAPLPAYQEPAESPRSTPVLAAEYPLVLTNAKRPQYLHSQHRAVQAIRKTMPAPTAELHPETAAQYGVQHGAWIVIETPRGRVRAQAEVTSAIAPGVVCGSHGWWEACESLGIGALDPFDERGANLNLLVHADLKDPISGGLPHRSSLCRLRPVEAPTPNPSITPATGPL